MTFEYKRQFPKGAKNNGHGGNGSNGSNGHGNGNDAGPHEPAASSTPNPVIEPMKHDDRVSRYIPTRPPPRDYGREGALARAEKQSVRNLRLREHLDCEPPWDIVRARATFDSPASPHAPWPDRYDIWPKDMAGYWPCPICASPLPTVARTAMKLFRCVGCDTPTFVHVTAAVVECPRHGRHEIDLPWMQNDSKWTYLGIDPPEIHPVGSALRDISELGDSGDGGDSSETEH